MWPRRATIRDDAGRPKLHRYYVLGTGKTSGVILHQFVGSDAPAVFHDHPWAWGVAIVLRGGYVEERRGGARARSTRRWLAPGRINVLRPGVFHRVELRDDRPAWTLFVHGRATRGWGFLDVVTGAVRAWSRSDAHHP
ncbi:MAG: hypothetical protein F9K40_19480 [Kofleriaceae bacterium]|nr:MAG: hypothetical protein F9K40_19480 [Kofleriaceae bacterium]MBZ0236581.1 hypothetical protein [Kofleriaceae bacterium]